MVIVPLYANLVTTLFELALAVTAVFLILLVLVQRGRGGGLAGALGGMGGSSAFGAKAGDVFTRITIGVAAFWIILCIVSVRMIGSSEDIVDADLGGDATVEDGLKPAPDGKEAAPGDADSPPGGASPAADPETPAGGSEGDGQK